MSSLFRLSSTVLNFEFNSSCRLLILLELVCDAVRLIRENGFRDNSYFYHAGDGGYAYHVNGETATSIYFKCAIYESTRCTGRAILRVGGAFRHTKEHTHPPDPDFVGMRHFRQNVLEQVRNARYVSYQDILNAARRDRRCVRHYYRLHVLNGT